MKRRQVEVMVSDHAVLRWLERRHGLNVAAVRRHIAGQAVRAAELDAAAVVVDTVRLLLRPDELNSTEAVKVVTVATVLQRDQRRGLGSSRKSR